MNDEPKQIAKRFIPDNYMQEKALADAIHAYGDQRAAKMRERCRVLAKELGNAEPDEIAALPLSEGSEQ